MFSNKKAQVGETITWIVATVIIIVVLTVAVVVADVYLESGKVAKISKTKDTLASKSFFSYLLTENSESGEKVFEQLKKEENLNEFNGNLAKGIFENYYGVEYLDVWVGFNFDKTLEPFLPNDYFGIRPPETRGGDLNKRSISHITEDIYLDEKKSIEIVLKVISK